MTPLMKSPEEIALDVIASYENSSVFEDSEELMVRLIAQAITADRERLKEAILNLPRPFTLKAYKDTIRALDISGGKEGESK